MSGMVSALIQSKGGGANQTRSNSEDGARAASTTSLRLALFETIRLRISQMTAAWPAGSTRVVEAVSSFPLPRVHHLICTNYITSVLVCPHMVQGSGGRIREEVFRSWSRTSAIVLLMLSMGATSSLLASRCGARHDA